MNIICHVYDIKKRFIVYTNTYSTDNTKYVCHYMWNYKNSIYWKIQYADISFWNQQTSIVVLSPYCF